MKKIITIILVAVVCTIGCGRDNADTPGDRPVIEQVFQEVPYEEFTNESFDYEVPEMLPGVLADRIGYTVSEDKCIYFLGDSLPDTFNLVSVSDNEVKYTGTIGEAVDIDGRYYCEGSITEYDVPGRYYIVTDKIGQSYPFIIGEDIYRDKLNEYIGLYDTTEGVMWPVVSKTNSTRIASAAVLNLLMAYELEPEKFPLNEDGEPMILQNIRYELEALQYKLDNGTIEDIMSEAFFASAMAAFSGIYKDYDLEFADTCLYRAENYYKDLQEAYNNGNLHSQYFLMLNAYLYRTTGKNSYKTVTENLLTGITESGNYEDYAYNPLYKGIYAYLNTSKTPNIDISFEVMNHLLQRAEDISSDTALGRVGLCDEEYLIIADTGNEGDEAYQSYSSLLENMWIMTYVNSVITNREYRTVIEEHMHYINGRNVTGEIMEPQDNEDYLYNISMLVLIYSGIDKRYTTP